MKVFKIGWRKYIINLETEWKEEELEEMRDNLYKVFPKTKFFIIVGDLK